MSNCQGETMSQWNWFKYKLRRRFFRNYNQEAEYYWLNLHDPEFQRIKYQVRTVQQSIEDREKNLQLIEGLHD